MNGCKQLIAYIGNIDIRCGENTCNGKPFDDGKTEIRYCKNCMKQTEQTK